MADDDRDFTIGKVDKDFSDDDNWGRSEDDFDEPEAEGEAEDEDEDENEDFVFGSGKKRVPPGARPSAVPSAMAGSEDPLAEEAGCDRRTSPLTMIAGAVVMILSAIGFYYFTTSPSPPVPAAPPAADHPLVAVSQPPELGLPSGTIPIAPAPVEPPAPDGPATATPPRETPTDANPAISIPRQPAPPVALKVDEYPASPAEESADAGAYAIRAGAFADPGNRDETLAKLRKLGFQGKTTPVTLVKPMIRLRVGVYSAAVAKRKLQAVARIVDTAFSLRQGKQLAVYAGSFQSADAAREPAARLARKGIKTKREQVKTKMTLWRLTLPGFADRESAEAAARRIRNAGLAAEVIQNP